MPQIVNIAIDRLFPHSDNPRKDLGDLSELAASIKASGVLQNLTVVPDEPDNPDTDYTIIIGHRRYAAAKIAGLTELPCIVVEMSEREQLQTMLVENMQRSDLNFFEEAAAIYALMQDRSMTQEETARRLGMSQPSLANKIRLLRLSGEEQRMVLENHLTERHARALLRMEDPEKRMAALKTVIERKMNVAQTDTYIKSLLEQEGQAKRPKRTFIAKDVRLFLNTIDHAVQTMKEAGIGAAFQRKETDEYYECVVRIPKSAAHKAS